MPAAPMPPPTHMVTNPYLSLRALHGMQECGCQLGSGAAERVAESDGSAAHVHFGRVQMQLLYHGQRLRGEGFI